MNRREEMGEMRMGKAEVILAGRIRSSPLGVCPLPSS